MGLGIDPRVGKGVNPEVFRPQPGTDHNLAFSGENVGPSAGLTPTTLQITELLVHRLSVHIQSTTPARILHS